MAKLSAEEIRSQFGLSYNQKHADKGDAGVSKYGGRDDGAIFSTDTGEYIGTIDNFSPKDESDSKSRASGIDSFKAVQDYEIKHGFRDDERTKWNRMNDVAGAVNNIYGSDGMEAEPEAEDPAIQLSRRTARAKAMERSYETAQREGNATQMAFGQNPVSGEEGQQQGAQSFMDDYKMQVKNYMEPGYSRKLGTAEDQRYRESLAAEQDPDALKIKR